MFLSVLRKSIVCSRGTSRALDLAFLFSLKVIDILKPISVSARSPGGSLLICGRGGVGRRTTVLLVSHMHDLEVFTPAVTRSYTSKSFRNDLKNLLQKVGVENKRVILFLEDHQFVEKDVLQMVNSLISSGEVHGLFSNQELESILSPLKEELASKGISHANLFQYFTSRVCHNLHVVLSMDYTHEDFEMRCESNPALLKHCTIIWNEGWSQDVRHLSLRSFFQSRLNRNETNERSIGRENLAGNAPCAKTLPWQRV